MYRDITEHTAKIICGQIRRRRQCVALFMKPNGFVLRPLHRVSDSELGSDAYVGAYTRRVSYHQIHKDWNDTI